MHKEQILEYLKNHKDEFFKKYQITKLALFGSFAKETNKQDSDIDIAIDTKLSDYFLLYDFKEGLEKAFGTKVDIVRLREKMNPSLKKHILKDGIYV
ncbi:MAG: nucleotidyltransferase family protein [Sulfurimonadaceae bacterium]